MALSSHALGTVAQAKQALTIQGPNIDALVEECINEASGLTRSAWGRDIVAQGSLTEYHPRDISCPYLGPVLYLNEWPIVSITSVHEDYTRVYGSTSLLTANTDYLVSKPVGKLSRLVSGLPFYWWGSWRAVRIIYIGGYQNVDNSISGALPVPPEILRVYYELLAWIIRQRSKGEVGLTVTSDALGSRTFSGPAYVTPAMQAALYAAGAVPSSLRGRTGERDA